MDHTLPQTGLARGFTGSGPVFFTLVFILALVGALYHEDWTITEQDIVVTKSLGPWCRTRRVPKARSLGIRVESLSGDNEAIFPYRLRFLDVERRDSGLWIELQMTHSVDRFLEALRTVLTVDAEDPRRSRLQQ